MARAKLVRIKRSEKTRTQQNFAFARLCITLAQMGARFHGNQLRDQEQGEINGLKIELMQAEVERKREATHQIASRTAKLELEIEALRKELGYRAANADDFAPEHY